MTEIVKKNEQFLGMPEEVIEDIKKFEDAIRKRHKETSKIKTDPRDVKQKAGFDYVEVGKMRNALDTEFPIWSWDEAGTHPVTQILNWIIVTGKLTVMDNGVKRSFFSPGAAQIQVKRGGDPNNHKDILSISNAVKSANIDGFKKAINMLTGLFDDVYDNVKDEPANDQQINLITDLVDQVNNPKYSMEVIETKFGPLNGITSLTADKIISVLKNNL